jgi:hypothetical protein
VPVPSFGSYSLQHVAGKLHLPRAARRTGRDRAANGTPRGGCQYSRLRCGGLKEQNRFTSAAAAAADDNDDGKDDDDDARDKHRDACRVPRSVRLAPSTGRTYVGRTCRALPPLLLLLLLPLQPQTHTQTRHERRALCWSFLSKYRRQCSRAPHRQHTVNAAASASAAEPVAIWPLFAVSRHRDGGRALGGRSGGVMPR